MNISGTSHIEHVPFWDNLKALNRDDRIKLISLLSASLIDDEERDCCIQSLDSCYGSWKTDESEDSLMKEIDGFCAEKSDFIQEFK